MILGTNYYFLYALSLSLPPSFPPCMLSTGCLFFFSSLDVIKPQGILLKRVDTAEEFN